MLEGIALIISIAASLVAMGSTTWSTVLSRLNSDLRSKIQNLATALSSQLSNGRVKVAKLTALLSSQNQQALTTYLYNNPVISKSLSSLTNDSALINQYSAQLSKIESDISSYQNQLASLGYAQSHKGTRQESSTFSNIKSKLNDAQTEYNNIVATMESSNLGSSTRSTTPYTADITAASQNVKGGIK